MDSIWDQWIERYKQRQLLHVTRRIVRKQIRDREYRLANLELIRAKDREYRRKRRKQELEQKAKKRKPKNGK